EKCVLFYGSLIKIYQKYFVYKNISDLFEKKHKLGQILNSRGYGLLHNLSCDHLYNYDFDLQYNIPEKMELKMPHIYKQINTEKILCRNLYCNFWIFQIIIFVLSVALETFINIYVLYEYKYNILLNCFIAVILLIINISPIIYVKSGKFHRTIFKNVDYKIKTHRSRYYLIPKREADLYFDKFTEDEIRYLYSPKFTQKLIDDINQINIEIRTKIHNTT